ncbi:hypothetical protein AKL17_3p0048 (plasmid) [Frigidibacter mobilis]|uniref:Uncharacterized protein n=1 Tax=Frigidibacter mobilis TaxID=1335048 RepID=A0A159ZBF9_9RHOB|nr:hypothetical protein AKL17_3p0048 [Frigidibacter mobilis]
MNLGWLLPHRFRHPVPRSRGDEPRLIDNSAGITGCSPLARG